MIEAFAYIKERFKRGKWLVIGVIIAPPREIFKYPLDFDIRLKRITNLKEILDLHNDVIVKSESNVFVKFETCILCPKNGKVDFFTPEQFEELEYG